MGTPLNEDPFPDAPMIRRLREREAARPLPAVSIVAPTQYTPVDKVTRDRLDRITENHPFMEGAP